MARRSRGDRGLLRGDGLAPAAGLDEAGVWPRLHAALLSELRGVDLLDLDDCAVDGSHLRALKGGSMSAPRRSTAPVPAPSTICSSTTTATPLAVTLTGATATTSSSSCRCWTRSHRSGAARTASPQALTPVRRSGYDLDKSRSLPWKRGIKPMIARRGVTHGSGLGKVRWGRARLRLAAPVQTTPHPLRTTPTSTRACSNSPTASSASAACPPHPETSSEAGDGPASALRPCRRSMRVQHMRPGWQR